MFAHTHTRITDLESKSMWSYYGGYGTELAYIVLANYGALTLLQLGDDRLSDVRINGEHWSDIDPDDPREVDPVTFSSRSC